MTRDGASVSARRSLRVAEDVGVSVVMKFGGTSVADPDAINRLIGIVRAAAGERPGAAPVVVVSALARRHRRAGRGGASWPKTATPAAAAAALQALLDRHLAVATAVTSDEPRRLLADVDDEFDELIGLVHALAVLREVSPRSHDAVLAVGELVSSRIVAAAFADHGIAERVGRRAHGAGHRRGAHAAPRPT